MTESTENGSVKKEFTILILGETGVGKSTFINALANYLLFENMTDAAENLQCVIPTSFAVYDEFIDDMKECSFGDPDSNEADDKTQSSTQSCRCYNFQSDEFTLKIIDTPGIADSRGVERDILNLKNLLNFLSNYKELNAICILLKPNNAKVGVVFKYCVLELLTHLNKSACQNILFLFSNSRGTFYKPGDTAKPLRKVLEDIRSKPPNVEIKFDQDNYFCFDNESFRYLVAVSEPNNVVFDEEAESDFAKSWQRSVNECQRLFQRISELKPHLVQDTISINDMRTKIINLRRPIALITETISKEIALCEQHEKKIREFTGDIKELEKELYTPALDIISEPLERPITVCSDPACCEKKSVNNTSKVHYKSICHKPCYLENVDDSIIGNAGLLDCAAFNKYKRCGGGRWFDPKTFHPDCKLKLNKKGLVWGVPSVRVRSETCFKCSHSYQVHLTINYETKIETKQIKDENKFERITTKQQAIDRGHAQINLIERKVKEIKQELHYITECSAYFARFLLNNTITPFNDALEDYIKCCIANERNGNNDRNIMKGFEGMLESYNREKQVIEELSRQGLSELTNDEVAEKIDQLLKLKHYGSIIKTHMELEKQGQLAYHMISKEKNFRIQQGDSIPLAFSKMFAKLKFW